MSEKKLTPESCRCGRLPVITRGMDAETGGRHFVCRCPDGHLAVAGTTGRKENAVYNWNLLRREATGRHGHPMELDGVELT